MSKKTSGQRTATPMQQAGINNLAYSIKVEREFQQEWGNLNNSELHKAAFEFEMLGFRLRHMLWNRHEQQNNPN